MMNRERLNAVLTSIVAITLTASFCVLVLAAVMRIVLCVF